MQVGFCLGIFLTDMIDQSSLNRLMNKLKPGAIPKINTSGGQFKMMENINKFQKAIKEYGVPDIDCFQTVDLYERRNIPQVTQCIMALGRTVCINIINCLMISQFIFILFLYFFLIPVLFAS